jgi:tetratricopeptide (TPR) repeat protein
MRIWLKCGMYFAISAGLLTAEPHWIKISTPHFEMYTTSNERSARDTLRYFEQIRSFFADTLPRPLEETGPVRIVAFSSEKEYQPYRPNEVAIAYYHETARHDYIVMSHTGAETFPIATHEYVHLVVRHSNLNLPPWINEGLAELYSTLRPMGDKILVGSLVAGRFQALLQDKWTPLAVILAAGNDSPYYNEKNKAGSLYNEGWALTHMLALSKEYRPKFPQVLKTISDGTPSADALEKLYGKPFHEVEMDLVTYLHGGRFQGVLIPAKLEKVRDDLSASSADDFDVQLLLAEIGDHDGNHDATRKILEQLIAQNPNRAEPYVDLADLYWRQNDHEHARVNFAKAFDLGDRDPRMLWDYGRFAESADAAKAAQVFGELLKLQPERLDVRMELASAQLQAHAAKDALETLAPVKKVTPENAVRLITLLAYANLGAGNLNQAGIAANQLKTVSSRPEDKERADQILHIVESQKPSAAASAKSAASVAAFEDGDTKPTLRRRDAPDEPVRPVFRRPSFSGNFAELQCAQPAKLVVETAEGKKLLLIDDPTKLLVNGSSGQTVDLTCGRQKPVRVRVDYDPPGADQPGIDGVARGIHFEQ